MATPSGKEQELLELINRMRTATKAELALLLNSSEPGIQDALKYFKVDLKVLQEQWDKLESAAPLAWSDQLSNAAAAHNQAMISTGKQEHQVEGEKDLAGRITDAGYTGYKAASENIYTRAKSVLDAHGSFAIDWGEDFDANGQSLDTNGIQDPAGHRTNILSKDYREVGISVIETTTDQVGPLVITQDFGDRKALDKKGYLLGVAFEDKNNDTWYQDGEGLKDIQLKITGVNGTNFSKTISVADAGGYQELLSAGRYQVDFIRNGTTVGRRITSIDASTTNNVKLDLVLPVVQLGLQNAATAGSNALDFRADQTLTTPDLTGKKIDISFSNVAADATYHNYAGIYRVEDDLGQVIDPTNGKSYKPGDSGYIEAALRRSQQENSGQAQLDNQNPNSNPNFAVDGGYRYAVFVVANGTMDQVLTATDPAKSPHVYFNYVAANADGKEHFQMAGNNTFAVEDTFNLTDSDYNDLIFTVNAKLATVA